MYVVKEVEISDMKKKNQTKQTRKKKETNKQTNKQKTVKLKQSRSQ